MTAARKLLVLILYGGDAATVPRNELRAWLAAKKQLNVESTIVAESIPHSEGSVDVRVKAAIKAADKAIAIVTVDERSQYGAPNVLEEIGRWRGAKEDRDLCIIRQDGVLVNSNMSGVVYLSFKSRIKETFDDLRDFLTDGQPADPPQVSAPTRHVEPSSTFVVDSNPATALVNNRAYVTIRVDEAPDKITLVIDCADGTAQATLRTLQQRSAVEVAYGNHIARGALEDIRFTQDARTTATLVVAIRDQQNQNAHMHDAAWGGPGGMSADDIGEKRASRLLTGEPRATKLEPFGPEMLIRGGMHDGLQVDESPIPKLIGTRARGDRETWESVRLGIVRQLILSRSVERVERLILSVKDGRLVHIKFRGTRHSYASNVPARVVDIDSVVDF